MPTELNRMLRGARARRRQRLEHRVRAQSRELRAAALAVRGHRRRGRLGAARHAAAAAGGAQRSPSRAHSATSVALVQVLVPHGRDPRRGRRGRRAPADRRRGAALGVRRTRRRTTTWARCGASAPACRWCSPSGRRARLRPRRRSTRIDRALRRRRGRGLTSTPTAWRAGRRRAPRLPGRLPGALLREAPLPLRRARARGAARFYELAAERGATSTSVPDAALRRRPLAYADTDGSRRRHPPASPAILDACSQGERLDGRRRRRAAALARPGRGRPRRRRAARAQDRPGRGHVHRRPQRQLHERLRHRLRLLRLLPPAGRHARGLRPAEARDLQEDRGDAGARRHRAC